MMSSSASSDVPSWEWFTQDRTFAVLNNLGLFIKILRRYNVGDTSVVLQYFNFFLCSQPFSKIKGSTGIGSSVGIESSWLNIVLDSGLSAETDNSPHFRDLTSLLRCLTPDKRTLQYTRLRSILGVIHNSCLGWTYSFRESESVANWELLQVHFFAVFLLPTFWCFHDRQAGLW